MEKEKLVTIKCPHCGWEYLPCEIFYPDDMLGKVSDVMRDDNGKVLFFNGESLNLKEEFVCDNCGTTFTVEGIINFKTKEVKDSFEDDWTTTEIK